MKLTKSKEIKEFKYKKKYHNKNASEDLNILKNTDSNIFLSKFLNNKNININNSINKLKNEILKKENLPNLKTNIQNIFANDEKKQKAIQYLIKIRKERNSSPSTDIKKILSSESTKDIFINQLDKEKNKEKGIEIAPYNIKKNRYINHINRPIITSYNLSQSNFYIKDKDKENSHSKKKEKQNININKTKSPFSNNSNNIYKNIFNTNSININNINNRVHMNKNNSNKTYDNLINKENNPINISENYNNSKINNNYAYTNYIRNYKISKIKNQLLNEKEINNYSIVNNRNINNNNNDNSFYIPKKPISIYTKRNIRNSYTDRDILNSNIFIKEIGKNKNRKYIATEIRKNNYKINYSKENNNLISLNESSDNKKIINLKEGKKFNNNNLYKINVIQFYITSKNKKEKLKNKFKNNLKINKNTGLYIKGINNNKNNFIFNNENEIIEYIKNKYNKQKNNDIGNNNIGLIPIDQVNKIKEKNEKLINKLKYENIQYKKELIDVRNQFNDLSKEIINIKEENEKLKDNIINNMINDENNDEFN